jgi:hypothetical protein
MQDFLQQHSRVLHAKEYVIDHFGKWVKPYYEVPRMVKIKALLNSFLKDPFFTVLSLIFQIIIRRGIFLSKETYKNGFWQPAISSKVLR